MSMTIAEISAVFSDLAPVPQDDGPKPVVSIQYSPDFVAAMDIFRAVLRTNEFSQRALELSEHIIRINSTNYTAWNYRRQILEAISGDWRAELSFCEEIADSNSKNYQLWQHRREIVKKLNDASTELPHTEKVLRQDAKHYHAWGHRQFVIAEYGLWDGELDFVERTIWEDPYNNSAWNQRWFVVTRNSTIPAWKDDDTVQSEVAFTSEHIRTFSDNESPWNYILGILHEVEFQEQLAKQVVNFSKSVLESDPTCRFAAATLFEIYEAFLKPPFVDEAVQVSESLEDILDPIRGKYWAWRRKEMLRHFEESR